MTLSMVACVIEYGVQGAVHGRALGRHPAGSSVLRLHQGSVTPDAHLHVGRRPRSPWRPECCPWSRRSGLLEDGLREEDSKSRSMGQRLTGWSRGVNMTSTSHSPREPLLQLERLGQKRPCYRLQSVRQSKGCRLRAADADLGALLNKSGLVHGVLRV